MHKGRQHAAVPPTEKDGHQTTPTSRRKSVVRKSSTFDKLETRSSETTSANLSPHVIDFQLMVNHIAVFDLENTGTRFDEQDPLVSIKIGDATAETAREEDAGVNASYSESFVFDLTEEDAEGEVSSSTSSLLL